MKHQWKLIHHYHRQSAIQDNIIQPIYITKNLDLNNRFQKNFIIAPKQFHKSPNIILLESDLELSTSTDPKNKTKFIQDRSIQEH